MRLADFLEHSASQIVDAAERFAETLLPAARHMDSQALRDHLPIILHEIAEDLRREQTTDDAFAKSHGKATRAVSSPETAAETHALLRAKSGFEIEQLVAEYRALRACVLRLWREHSDPLDSQALGDIIRFNEAIDQAVAESVAFFTAEVERWRHIFLGVLGHDLRGPLNSILMTSEVLSRLGAGGHQNDHISRLIRSGKRMQGLLDDLLDYSRSSLGLGMHVRREHTDLASACAEELDVLRSALPGQQIDYEVQGATQGKYDASRVREALGNLVSNAARYGTSGSAILVHLSGDGHKIQLSVENHGDPIAGEMLEALFEPLRRGALQSAGQQDERTNLGLGLFIVKEIATAHGGTVQAESAHGKTRFIVTLAALG